MPDTESFGDEEVLRFDHVVVIVSRRKKTIVENVQWESQRILYYPFMVSHFSPTPVKTDRGYKSNKPIKSKWL